MASLYFTPNLAAATVAELFERYFATWPAVRGFVLDDQGEVRHHVKVLVDGRNLRDRRKLTDNIQNDSQVYVFQALSGG